MELSIIPECYVDTNLIETLARPKKGFNHQKGCGTVAKRMQEEFKDSFCVGIIDRDKYEVDYLKEFKVIKSTESLILYKHPNKHHYIIQICPAVEKFILRAAAAVEISIEDYNLPTELPKLMKVSKTVASNKDVRFRNLFKAIINTGYDEFISLRNWLHYLIAFNYDATLEDLERYDGSEREA